MTATVAVLGGGVAGLTAAHELSARGFDVTVYERNDRPGGKARSLPGPDRGDGPPLPAEHGFRFFPGFYWHLPDTMGRIPYGDDGTVRDNLVGTDRTLRAFADGPHQRLPTGTPATPGEWRRALSNLFGGSRVPPDETAFFVSRLLVLLGSCEARWRTDHEHTPWWEFIAADAMSPAYRSVLGHGVTRSLVAMRPEVGSTRTIGRVYLQMLRGLFDPDFRADRLLNGPTSEVWIDPWVEHVRDLGATVRTNATVTGIHADGERVTGVTVAVGAGNDAVADGSGDAVTEGDGTTATDGSADAVADGSGDAVADEAGDARTVTADHYVAALPVEAMQSLSTPALRRAAPGLADVDRLETAWMNGVQFYLRREPPLVRGHAVYYDSPWALTSVPQSRFWTEFDVSACGDGTVEGVLSVIVSDWETPGVVHGKPARECSPTEIREEVWTQLRTHLDRDGPAPLSDADVVDWFLDPAVATGDGTVRNREPLLINTVGSLQHRPRPRTAADNLVLAADYVRTSTDLACMEAANEAARRAVNAVLDRSGGDAPRCEVRDLEPPRVAAPLRAADALGHRLGAPPPGGVGRALWRTFRGR